MTPGGATVADAGSPPTRVTVITPTVPGREVQLEACKASVEDQTVHVDHAVHVDQDRAGPQAARNFLVAAVDTEWVLPLDDDDTLDPGCVQTLLDRAGDADIVYPWVRCDPETAPMSMIVNKLFDPGALFRMNYIPCTALIRTSVFRMLGGYRPVQLEDWDLWQRAWLHGVRFKCVPIPLWTYHFHGGQHFQRAA